MLFFNSHFSLFLFLSLLLFQDIRIGNSGIDICQIFIFVKNKMACKKGYNVMKCLIGQKQYQGNKFHFRSIDNFSTSVNPRN